MVTRYVMGILLAYMTVACAHEPQSRADVQKPFWERVEPAPSFRFQGTLYCETLLSTDTTFVGGRFTLRDADTPSVSVVFSRGSPGRRMARIHDDAERTVFQAADEEPGSVDTLSLDKVHGTFVRMWSGWTLESKQLGAGGERGRCRVAVPDLPKAGSAR